MNFEDAWSSRRTRRLAAARLRATGPKARSCTATRVTPQGHPGLRPSLREMFGAVVSGTARHGRLPMKKDSASPTGQSPLPPPLEPETKKPKIGWKMKNVSRSTVEVRLLDFRGHRDVMGEPSTPKDQCARSYPTALPADRQPWADATLNGDARLDAIRSSPTFAPDKAPPGAPASVMRPYH
jgi:hypothetical protein